MPEKSKLQRIEEILLTKVEDFPVFINLPRFIRVAEKIMEQEPGLVEAFFLTCAHKSTMSQGELGKEIGGIVEYPRFHTSPEWVNASLEVCRKYSPPNYPSQLALFVMRAFRQYHEQGMRDTFTAVCGAHKLGTRMDLSSAKSEIWGGLELIGQLVRAEEMVWQVKTPKPKRLFEQAGEEMFTVLIEHGADLERTTSANLNDEDLTFYGILHRACHDHEINPIGRGVINIALNCGADWENLLQKQRLGEESLRVIENHPMVRRKKLNEVSGARASLSSNTIRRPSL